MSATAKLPTLYATVRGALGEALEDLEVAERGCVMDSALAGGVENDNVRVAKVAVERAIADLEARYEAAMAVRIADARENGAPR